MKANNFIPQLSKHLRNLFYASLATAAIGVASSTNPSLSERYIESDTTESSRTPVHHVEYRDGHSYEYTSLISLETRLSKSNAIADSNFLNSLFPKQIPNSEKTRRMAGINTHKHTNLKHPTFYFKANNRAVCSAIAQSSVNIPNL